MKDFRNVFGRRDEPRREIPAAQVGTLTCECGCVEFEAVPVIGVRFNRLALAQRQVQDGGAKLRCFLCGRWVVFVDADGRAIAPTTAPNPTVMFADGPREVERNR